MKQANWIWLDSKIYPDCQKGRPTTFCPPAPYVVARFVKKFTTIEKSAFVKIEADVKYFFYVNGKIVSRGPCAVGGDYGNVTPLGWCFSDKFEIPLINGENTVSVLVMSVPEMQADYSSGYPGLRCEITFGNERIVTDESWLASPAPEYFNYSRYDANRELSTIPDHKAVISDREIKILEKNISELKYEPAYPVKEYEEDGRKVLDYGKIVAGYVTFDIQSEGGVTVVAEENEVEKRVTFPDTIITKKGLTHYESLLYKSFRFVYIKSDKPCDVKVSVSCPYFPCENEGSFTCSDAVINKIFDCSSNALKMCRQTYHLDSPIHQEPLGCTGDYYIESMMAYAVLGEYSLSELDIIRTAMYLQKTNGYMFHTAYTLIWFKWIREHYLYTGNKALLKKVLPAMETVTSRFLSFAVDGWLDNSPNYMFIDWVPVENFNMHHPPRALGEGSLNAFWYSALNSLGEIYNILSMPEKATKVFTIAESVKRQYKEKLFDNDRGIFKAGTLDKETDQGSMWKPLDPSRKTYYCTQNNILAVAFGIVEGDIATEIMEKVVNDQTLITCQPYFYHFYFIALEKANLLDKYMLPVARKLEEICVNGSLKEVFFGFDCDFSHAWGGTVMYEAIARILGVKPTSKGFETYSVESHLGDLDWAEGVVPTPWGKIKVKVYRENGVVKTETEEIRV